METRIEIFVEDVEDETLFWATSPDLAGFAAAADSIEAIRNLAQEHMAFLGQPFRQLRFEVLRNPDVTQPLAVSSSCFSAAMSNVLSSPRAEVLTAR